MIQLKSGDKEFPAYVARPSSGEVKGGLIVVHEVWGLAEHIKDVAERFADEGYLVLAPDVLSETGIEEKVTPGLAEALFDPERRSSVQPKLRELMAPLHVPGFGGETIAKLRSCFDYLFEQAETKQRLAITGFCFGGTYSFGLAASEPRLKAAVPFYGHADYSIKELKNITCPILAFYGESDENLMQSLPELKEKMKQANVDFTPVVYPDCGHAFFNSTNRFTYNPVAAQDAWQRTLSFLEANLQTTS